MSKMNILGSKSLLAIILLAGMMICACSSELDDTEISQELAWEIVKKKVLGNQTEGIEVYVSNDPIPPHTIMSEDASVTGVDLSPDFTSWFFFIDDMPLANWAHPCRYVCVHVVGGNYVVYKRRWFPCNQENMIPLIEMEPVPFDPSKYSAHK